jgi:dTDP-4-amino-4,6-dideoxygalactose transaminase
MGQSEQSLGRVPLAAPDVSERAAERVASVLDSGHLAAGEEVKSFEREFAAFCGAEHAVAVANGTAALHAALAACGIGEGDTVVTTPLSFVATANAARFCGADVVFADVDPETLLLDPDAVRAVAADHDIDAVLPVHLYGLPAAMDELGAIAEEFDAVLVEDAAQAHGARYRGDPVGTIGDVGTFSFYPTKNMTTGEGGMVVTDDDAVAERARQFINHGRDDDGDHVSLGHNFRMTNLAGAVGRVQLERLPGFVRDRRGNAACLTAALADGPVETPPEPAGRRHAYHQYTVRCDDRAALVDHLDEHGVDSGVYYPRPIHEEGAYDHVDARLPVAERASESVLSVPVHPGLLRPELERVTDALAEFAGTAR